MAVISLPHRDSGNLKKRVAEEVRALKARRDVTQATLASVLGISQPQVGKRLKGEIAFSLEQIEMLADFFGVNPAELLGERVIPRPGGPDGGASNGGASSGRAWRDSNSQPSDPKVRPLGVAA